MDERQRPKGPSALLSWVVIAVAFAVTALGVYKGVNSLANGVFDPTAIESGEGGTALDAEKGTYYVFQFVGESSRDDIGSAFGPARLRATDVRVTGPDGRAVPTLAANSFETYRSGVSVYQAAVKFTTTRAGIHTVRVTDPDATTLVKRAAFDVVGSTLAWFGVAALGGLGLAIGIILLIVGVVRRGRSATPALAGAPTFTLIPTPPAVVTPPGAPRGVSSPTAAGWYPDPWQQATWRYHDGVAWTSHTG